MLGCTPAVGLEGASGGVSARCDSKGGPCTGLQSGGGHAWMSRTGSGMSMGIRARCQVNLGSFHGGTAGPLFFRTNWQVLK